MPIGFLRIFGTNAIAAFALSSVITAALDGIHLRIGSMGSGAAAISLHHAA